MAGKQEEAKPAGKPADPKADAAAAKDGAAKSVAAKPAAAKPDATKPGAVKPATAKSGGRKKLIIMIAAGTIVLAAGGGAAAYFLLGDKPAEPEHAEPKHESKKVPVFVDLETFTVNLREPDDDRFLQIKLVAELKDAPSGEMLKTMMPAVRNEILLTLGSKQAQELASREGKEKLAQEIVAAANKPLAGTPAEKSVESVNFTHLIIQ